MKLEGYLSASEAAQALDISLPTLYSYVSRGLLRSEFADPGKRTRRYHAEDVERLKQKQEMRRDPQKTVNTALHWGTPMLDSALTLIDSGQVYYRGRNVCELAVECTVEQVAALLWTGEEKQADLLFAQPLRPLSPLCEAMLALLRAARPMERFQALLPLLAAYDLPAYDLRAGQTAQTGARILQRMTLLAVNQNTDFDDSHIALSTPRSRERSEQQDDKGDDTPGEAPERSVPRTAQSLATPHFQAKSIAMTLQQAWVPDQPQAVSLLNVALIVCADHELNVSSFTARCVASAGATPYAVVSAGLAALQGAKHGGSCDRVEALLRETERPDRAGDVISQRVRRGEMLPGFGHPLYPNGDPRGRLLLERVTAACPNVPGVALAKSLAEASASALNELPNVDFGLVTLCSALALPPGTAITLFALGRVIGWIAHAGEEYRANRMIRPRAHYIGNLPNTKTPNA